jgi:hypothetical protein
MRHLFACLALVGAVLFAAAPAFAHDCFNPNKPADAGVNYTITSFDPPPTNPSSSRQGPGRESAAS